MSICHVNKIFYPEMYIYILELENDKFYIGRTNCLKRRLSDHINGNGSVWTKLYKPQKVLKVFETKNPFFEDMIVLSFMKRYGRENVRGGSFSMIVLNNNMDLMISILMKNAFDECLRCGGSHFVKDCGRSDIGQKNRSQERLAQEFDVYMRNIIESEPKKQRNFSIKKTFTTAAVVIMTAYTFRLWLS